MNAIARDEWLAALHETGQCAEDDQDAVTIPEFAVMFSLTRSTAEFRLESLVKAGKATKTKKWVTNSYGRRVHYNAYRLVK